jgi:hypothetical protein
MGVCTCFRCFSGMGSPIWKLHMGEGAHRAIVTCKGRVSHGSFGNLDLFSMCPCLKEKPCMVAVGGYFPDSSFHSLSFEPICAMNLRRTKSES